MHVIQHDVATGSIHQKDGVGQPVQQGAEQVAFVAQRVLRLNALADLGLEPAVGFRELVGSLVDESLDYHGLSPAANQMAAGHGGHEQAAQKDHRRSIKLWPMVPIMAPTEEKPPTQPTYLQGTLDIEATAHLLEGDVFKSFSA